MQLKELIDTMSFGTHYKLLGAKTGKQLANSYTNREGHIKAFYNDEVSGFSRHSMRGTITLRKLRKLSDRLSAFG